MNVGDCVFLKGFAKRMTIVAINGNTFHCCWYKEDGSLTEGFFPAGALKPDPRYFNPPMK